MRTEAYRTTSATRPHARAPGFTLVEVLVAAAIMGIAFVALLNWSLSWVPHLAGEPITLERILGFFCAPLAWIMGIEWADAPLIPPRISGRPKAHAAALRPTRPGSGTMDKTMVLS